MLASWSLCKVHGLVSIMFRDSQTLFIVRREQSSDRKDEKKQLAQVHSLRYDNRGTPTRRWDDQIVSAICDSYQQVLTALAIVTPWVTGLSRLGILPLESRPVRELGRVHWRSF